MSQGSYFLTVAQTPTLPKVKNIQNKLKNNQENMLNFTMDINLQKTKT